MLDYEPEEAVELLQGGDREVCTSVVTVMARAYTRGNGFTAGEPNEEITAVIVTAAARLAANTAGFPIDQTAGEFSQSLRGAFGGWTLAEQFVLNRYRVRAQ
ncbi:hypothetical protein [Mycolicibacter algericus]|uniref:hypothetical protein n=1 Tax=Mycolicibacter algericus TaxID=1288388 RepID=UPI003C763126